MKLRPSISILILVAAVSIPVLSSRSFTFAQNQSSPTCQDATHPVVLVGNFPPSVRGFTTQAYIFRRSSLGDRYLQSLATSANALPLANNATPADIKAFEAALQKQMLDSFTLQQSLPGLFQTMYGVIPYNRGVFLCGGIQPGQYSLLGLERPIACPPALPTPTGMFSVRYQYSPPPGRAGCATPDPNEKAKSRYYYSWVTLDASALTNLAPPPQPAKSGAAPSPTNTPSYRHITAHAFVPIAQFPKPYF